MPHVEVPQAEFKVVLLGDTNTGKTCLVLRFVEGYYKHMGRSSTIGAFFLTKRLTVNSITCKMLLWDTAGQEQFRKLAVTYYKNAAAAILCYDVSNPRSLVKLRTWLEELKAQTGHNIVIAIVACKMDLEPVPGLIDEAKKLAAAEDALYFETSAKDNEGVSELFHKTAERVLEWQEQAEHGYVTPLSVTLGGNGIGMANAASPTAASTAATSNSGSNLVPHSRSISPRTNKRDPAVPETVVESSEASAKSQDQDNSTRSTANDSDDVNDDCDDKRSEPRVMCESGLLVCGGEDSRACCIV